MRPLPRRILALSIAAIALTFTVVSCGDEERKAPDISGKEVGVSMERFDRELFGVDPNKLANFGPEWAERYGAFYKVYVQQIMRFGSVEDTVTYFQLQQFLADRYVQELQAKIDEVFPNEDGINPLLVQGFSMYADLFPGRPVPRVIAMNSGMGYAVAPIDSVTVAVGLEYYLGRDYERYQQMEFLNQYQIRRMDPQNASVDCVRGWIETEFLLHE